MLEEHRNVVEALRDALLEREELIGDEILEVIRSSQPALPTPWPAGRTGATADTRIAADRAPPDHAGSTWSPPAGGQPCSAQLLHRPRKTTSSESTVMP